MRVSMQFMSRCSIPAATLWIVSVIVTAARPMECWRANNYVCPATFVSMIISSIVSRGPGALETGPVCYGGAEEGAASTAWVYSKHVI
jgi:hypothetical protein